MAAAFHDILQELGDFGVLLHGGWSKGRALAFNFAALVAGAALLYALRLA